MWIKEVQENVNLVSSNISRFLSLNWIEKIYWSVYDFTIKYFLGRKQGDKTYVEMAYYLWVYMSQVVL